MGGLLAIIVSVIVAFRFLSDVDVVATDSPRQIVASEHLCPASVQFEMPVRVSLGTIPPEMVREFHLSRSRLGLRDMISPLSFRTSCDCVSIKEQDESSESSDAQLTSVVTNTEQASPDTPSRELAVNCDVADSLGNSGLFTICFELSNDQD